MGLDITAFSKIKPAEGFVYRDGDAYAPDGTMADWEKFQHLWPNPDFPRSAGGLVEGVYSFEAAMRFRAGPYSFYNRWREWLADLVGVDLRALWGGEIDDCPFYELLNFSDCEGDIGAEAAKALLADFDAYADKAGSDELFRRFREACRLAADGGALRFS